MDEPVASPKPPELTSRQRKRLRALAHDLKPVVQTGTAGVTDAVVAAAHAGIQTHELIKIRMREPEDKNAMAAELATRLHATLCGLVGHTVILYRRHPTKPQIEI